MSDVLWLILGAVLSYAGMAWLALAMDAHWGQVMHRPAKEARAVRRGLRWLGAVTLGLSLLACLAADQASMAIIEWVMLLGAGAMGVALTLSRRPRWLMWLWPFSPARSADAK